MNKRQGLFWIKGHPGSGKSVLIKHAVRNMREQNPSNLVIAFFFHGQGVDLQKTPLGLFRALLNLLLGHFLEYLIPLTAKFEDREKRYGAYTADRWKWSSNELQEILSNVLTKGTQHQPSIIFIDALDECGGSSAKNLLAYFRDITDPTKHKNGRVRVCLSSRHYPILDPGKIPAVLVEERNDRDIRWYTQERLKDIQSKHKREQIENEVLSKADGGFQWAFLVTEVIIDGNLAGIRVEKLLEEVRTCPQNLGELYEAILASVQEAKQRQTLKLFQWVLFAERPLSAQELRDALAIDTESGCTSVSELRAHEGWSDTLEDFERYVKHISKGLIHFQSRDVWEQYVPGGEDSDREAQLIHQSVADFLMDTFFDNVIHCPEVFPSQAAAGHFQISRSCLRYLTMTEVLEGAQQPRGILSSEFPLAPYAVQFLFEHVRKAEQEGIIQSDLLSVLQWTAKSATIRKLAVIWRTMDPGSAHTPLGWPFVEATAMHVLIAFGSRSAVDFYLKTSYEEADGRDSDGNTPLMLALIEGHEEIALSILDFSLEQQALYTGYQMDGGDSGNKHSENQLVDLNAKNNDEDTALDIAIERDAREVVLKLFEACDDLKYMERQAAVVAYAISIGNTELLSILIRERVDLHGAVYFATEICTTQRDQVLEEMVSELLKAGADTARSFKNVRSAQPEDYDTDRSENDDAHDNDALMLASRRGLVGIVDLVLSRGALATRQNDRGECATLVAADNGHVETVQSLLRKEPSSAGIEDSAGRTALTVAIHGDQLDLSKLILREGSFSNLSPSFQSVIHDIVKRGVVDLVQPFLDNTALDHDVIDEDGDTPLWSAVKSGHTAVVELLLNTGKIDVNSKDIHEGTPLLYAAQNGHTAVVDLLLSTGKVDVNSKDIHEGTPLLHAAQNGHTAVVDLLLSTGKVDVNYKDIGERTPLLSAAQNGNTAIVELLLDTSKVSADSKDKGERTPLLWAAKNGHVAVVEQLLDTGKVSVNSKDRAERTPLLWAVQNGHTAVVKLLLDISKVEVDTTDKSGWTPLSLAAARGYEAVVKLLLDTGEVEVDREIKGKWTSLRLAARCGHEDVVKHLLDTGKVAVDSEDVFGQTALWMSAMNGHEAVVELLLETGKVAVNTKDIFGRTVLSMAAKNGREAVVELLLETGKVNVDSKDVDGNTALLMAAKNGHGTVVKLLLETGKVNLNSKNVDGNTALWMAARNEHETVVKLLRMEMGKTDVD